jgi:hypothetical protein
MFLDSHIFRPAFNANHRITIGYIHTASTRRHEPTILPGLQRNGVVRNGTTTVASAHQDPAWQWRARLIQCGQHERVGVCRFAIQPRKKQPRKKQQSVDQQLNG